MSALNLILVADDPLARAGLAAAVAELPGCTPVGLLSSGQLEQLPSHVPAPDLILWDVGWEPPARLPAWEEWGIPVLALLAAGEDAAAIWVTGVRGLLPRLVDSDRLATAVAAIHHGFLVIDSAFSEEMLPEQTISPVRPGLSDALTSRENEVLQLLAEGLTNKAIAQKLEISEHTVKFHVNAIMSKLGAQSRTEAVVRATRLGLILL